MRAHIIFDYTYLYYKYTFALDSGKMKHIKILDDSEGVNCERDISQIYYSLREIESARRKFEEIGHDISLTVCFDMPTSRKEKEKDYKSGRASKLKSENFKDIEKVEEMLRISGYNTLRIDGYEADDLVTSVVKKFKNDFDYTLIYTPDKDLVVNVCDNVGINRYKSTAGYSLVNIDNYEEYLEKEFKVRIPYNTLGLYLSTVGDKSDSIKGIKGFGNAAWKKLIDWYESNGVNWKDLRNFDDLEELLNKAKDYLGESKFNEALESFNLVRPMIKDDVEIGLGKSTIESREKAYMKWEMKSLVK